MEERIDYTVKWYLRIVAGTYLLMFIPITLHTLGSLFAYPGAYENYQIAWYFEHLYEWYLTMPFFEGRLYFSPFRTTYIEVYFNESLIPYIFWSFWLGTLIRWNITGKHFYQ